MRVSLRCAGVIPIAGVRGNGFYSSNQLATARTVILHSIRRICDTRGKREGRKGEEQKGGEYKKTKKRGQGYYGGEDGEESKKEKNGVKMAVMMAKRDERRETMKKSTRNTR